MAVKKVKGTLWKLYFSGYIRTLNSFTTKLINIAVKDVKGTLWKWYFSSCKLTEGIDMRAYIHFSLHRQPKEESRGRKDKNVPINRKRKCFLNVTVLHKENWFLSWYVLVKHCSSQFLLSWCFEKTGDFYSRPNGLDKTGDFYSRPSDGTSTTLRLLALEKKG